MENKKVDLSKTRLDFEAIRSRGQRTQVNPWLVCYWLPNNLKNARIVWNISRKVAKANIRNKLKRWVREFVRLHLSEAVNKQGLDLNFVFRPQTKLFYKDLQHEEIDRELFQIKKKIDRSFQGRA